MDLKKIFSFRTESLGGSGLSELIDLRVCIGTVHLLLIYLFWLWEDSKKKHFEYMLFR